MIDFDLVNKITNCIFCNEPLYKSLKYTRTIDCNKITQDNLFNSKDFDINIYKQCHCDNRYFERYSIYSKAEQNTLCHFVDFYVIPMKNKKRFYVSMDLVLKITRITIEYLDKKNIEKSFNFLLSIEENNDNINEKLTNKINKMLLLG